MNERIKELAEQAGINCIVPTFGPLEYPSKGEVDHLKKFAELIVAECANVAVEAESTGVARLIMIHFGVEE